MNLVEILLAAFLLLCICFFTLFIIMGTLELLWEKVKKVLRIDHK